MPSPRHGDMEEHEDNTHKLKSVFDLCDPDNKGVITVAHFQDLIKEQFGGASDEELVAVINLLDPECKGTISFENFCRGVQEIIELHSQVQTPVASPNLDLLTDFDPFSNPTRDPFSTLTPIKVVNDLDSSLGPQTLTEYDTCTTDDDSGIIRTNGVPLIDIKNLSDDEHDSAISGKSSEFNENSSKLSITDEENYEDFGEDESDSCRTYNKSRISSNSLASELQRRSPTERRKSFDKEIIIDDIDGNFQELDDRVKYLEDELISITKKQVASEDKHFKLKEENHVLIKKINTLEENVRDVEIQAREQLAEERLKHQEFLNRKARDKEEKMEYLMQRCQKLEQEIEDYKEQNRRLQAEIDRLRLEKTELDERLSDSTCSETIILDDNEKLQTRFRRQQEEFEQERLHTAELLDEMGKELTELRKYKIEHSETRDRRSDSTDNTLGALEMEITSLRTDLGGNEENKSLKETNEDLGAQLLTQCMEEGRNLLKEEGGRSLAEELEQLTKEELMDAVKEEQDTNRRLKQYVDRILVVILENNPNLLDINVIKG